MFVLLVIIIFLEHLNVILFVTSENVKVIISRIVRTKLFVISVDVVFMVQEIIKAKQKIAEVTFAAGKKKIWK